MLDRIDTVLGQINDPNDEDFRVLTAIAHKMRSPEYRNNEDALSSIVLHQLAGERLHRLEGSYL